MKIATLNDIYDVTCSLDRAAVFKFKKGGEWTDMGITEFRDSVRYAATALRHLGVKPGDRVAILAENRPEWAISDFAILCNAAISVPVYPTLLAWQIEFILKDSGSVAVLCSTEEQLKKVLEVRALCPSVRTVVRCDPAETVAAGVLTFAQLLDSGRQNDGEGEQQIFEELRRQPRPDDVATLVYTSGTTGNPKGAMLTHGNIASNLLATCEVLPIQRGQVALSILPLSHILERTADYAYLYKGCTIAYAESVLKFAENLQEVRPHLFAAVPRVFEKMRARMMDAVAAYPAPRRRIFLWALSIAEKRLPYRIERKPMPVGLKVQSAIADKLVFSKIKARLGGRVQFVLSGGAPLSEELASFFIGAGLEIMEGYGLTETSPVIAVNRPEKRRIGTVDPLIPGVEVQIAADGEILSRGPHVMKGYWNNPEATAQAIDADGWFHTGDIGLLDADGFLHITDRKKDIIINAYGKNIAPQPLEALLKSSPYVGTPVLIGDRRNYLVALLVPNFEKLERDVTAMGVAFRSREELVGHEAARKIFQDEIDRFNLHLNRQEQVRRFAILPRDFTIEADEITPSLKVKRRNIDRNYKSIIDGLYSGENPDAENVRA